MDIINTLTGKSLTKYFNHTFLKVYAAGAGFEKLCKEARELDTAMVAINSTQVCICKELLRGYDVHVGAVISFPLGQAALEIEVEKAKKVIQNGSDEIDYVINIGEAKMGHWDYIEEEMHQITEICRAHKVIGKVTFENCYLEKEEIKKLAEIAEKAKPNYIKTSIGFGASGTTLEDVCLVKGIIGDDVKVKAAGGVRDWETCKAMTEAGAERIGISNSIAILESLRSERGRQK